MNIEKTVNRIPPQTEYIKLDNLKKNIMSDPIYSKCPVCGRKSIIKECQWRNQNDSSGNQKQVY